MAKWLKQRLGIIGSDKWNYFFMGKELMILIIVMI